MATIHLKTSFFPLAFLLFLFPAHVVIDGGPKQKVGWGETDLPLAAGQHTLEVFFPYIFMNAGKATTQVTVAEGQTVQAAYRAPWLIFLPGKLKVA